MNRFFCFIRLIYGVIVKEIKSVNDFVWKGLVNIEDLIISLADAFKNLSYFGIFLALCIEFVPAEVVLPLAGYWVSEGDMAFIGVVAAGSIGGVVGPLTLYWLGRYGGRPFLNYVGITN